MPNTNHYFVEESADGKFAVRAKGSARASGLFDTQEEAIARVKELNASDRPDVARVRNREEGGPDEWRSAN